MKSHPRVVPPESEGHDWQPIDLGSPYYGCVRCHISGKVKGGEWPPMRDPKFIMPEFRTCAGARKAKLLQDLRKYNPTITMEDLE